MISDETARVWGNAILIALYLIFAIRFLDYLFGGS